jgi:hypothetical protein
MMPMITKTINAIFHQFSMNHPANAVTFLSAFKVVGNRHTESNRYNKGQNRPENEQTRMNVTSKGAELYRKRFCASVRIVLFLGEQIRRGQSRLPRRASSQGYRGDAEVDDACVLLVRAEVAL